MELGYGQGAIDEYVGASLQSFAGNVIPTASGGGSDLIVIPGVIERARNSVRELLRVPRRNEKSAIGIN
jgi:hypothetical protein